MASKLEKLVCKKLSKKERHIAQSEVCAKNIYFLSNNDVKIVLSKYSTLSLEEKAIVRQFNNYLKTDHFNRFNNLSKFFKQAFNSDNEAKSSTNKDVSVDKVEKTESKQLIAPTTNDKSEQKILTDVPSTDNNSVVPNSKQESTIAPFHTNIISSKVNTNNNNNNNLVNINPFFTSIFPMIHQKVLNQCIPSALLPQVLTNNVISNITAVLNLAQNINTTSQPVNNPTNTSTESQNEPIENSPSKIQPENSYVLQTSDKKIKKSEIPNLVADKRNETETSNKSKNINEIHLHSDGKKLKNSDEIFDQLKNNVNINNTKNEETTKYTPNKPVQNPNNTIKSKPVQTPNNTIKSEPKSNDMIKIEQESPSNNTTKIEPNSPSNNPIKFEPTSSSNKTNRKEPETVQDLESFSMEYMKKIKTFAQHNSIKLNLSSSSQKKISETNNKIKQRTESKIINLYDIKPFFNDAEINLQTTEIDKNEKGPNIIKTSYDNNIKTSYDNNIKTSNDNNIIKTPHDKNEKRLIEYLADNSKTDQKTVKSKIISNSPDDSKERCKLYSNDYRKNASSKSDFLDECNFLKSIISKNSHVVEKSSKKEKVPVILIKKSKKKRKRNKKIDYINRKQAKLSKSIVVVEVKKQIDSPEKKAIIPDEETMVKESIEKMENPQKRPQKREVKVVNRILRNDSPNDQIIKSISEKPFTDECNKVTNTMVFATNQDTEKPFTDECNKVTNNMKLVTKDTEKPFTEECNKVTNEMVYETKQDVKCKLDKRMETEDLMVLLKYFYKLDGVEQRRLIEFLKELELTEPQRVADLRKHVRTSPPDDEDTTVVQNSQLDTIKEPIELDDRPPSTNSDLSNIDLILEDIDSILNDEDNEDSSNNNKEEITEPATKRLKMNDAKCDTTVLPGKTIPVQFKNSQNYTYNCNQNDYSSDTSYMQYNNFIHQNINYITQNQNYGFSYENQYFQNNLRQAYELSAAQLFIQNQSLQNPRNYYEDYQNVGYNYYNSVGQYQQNYSNYQNGGYFQ